MPFNINEFKSGLRYGGARNSLFQVFITNPVNPTADIKVPIQCRAATLPQRVITKTPIAYFGRAIHEPGVVAAYEDWAVTIYNDEDYLIKNALEEWSHTINSPIGNIRRTPTSESTLIKSTADVYHYSKTGQILRHYKFNGIWPISVGQIDLNWQSEDIMEYQVVFAVDEWVPGEKSTTGFAGGLNI